MSDMKMGLGAPPDPIYLYVAESVDEQGNPHPWHMFDHDAKKQIPIKERALTGVVSGLRMKMGPEFKGKKPVKLQIQIETGEQPYVVQSGVDTTFTRGVLLALDMVEDLTQPLMLVVANGGEKVVFGRIHYANNRQRIQVMWDKERKIFPMVQKLQTKLGMKTQTWEDVQATEKIGTTARTNDDPYEEAPPPQETDLTEDDIPF
jgi:hypothetical protein